jgi:hypothetical protein
MQLHTHQTDQEHKPGVRQSTTQAKHPETQTACIRPSCKPYKMQGGCVHKPLLTRGQ